VLKLRKNELGLNHSDTVVSMINLGITYWNQGRYSQAALLLEEALPLHTTLLGREHPDTLDYASKLATVYRKLNRNPEADQLERDYSFTPG
jgi:Tfp pilus assembly protein PilF